MANNYDVDGGMLKEVVVKGSELKPPFYYDQQITDRLTSVYLHVNRVMDKNGEWKSPSEPVDSDGYTIRPIARAILSEDYQVAVSNTWSQFGDDAIGSAFNSLKPFAPYAGHLAKMTQEMSGKMNDMKISKDESVNSSFSNVMEKIVSKVGEVSEKGAKLLNRSLIVQGTRFSYYSGTGVGFGNLSMKFTIFSGYVQDYKTGEYKWKDAEEQLSDLYPYVMGQYSQGVLDDNGNIKGVDIPTEIKGEVASKINEFLAWELPPGGYEPDTRNVDNIQTGTLKLRFGVYYSLNALLCTSAQFNYSKQMVKHWDGSINRLSPLYCDVMLTFQPATKYSDEAMKRFMSGEAELDGIKEMKDVLSDKIELEKYRNNKFLNGKK